MKPLRLLILSVLILLIALLFQPGSDSTRRVDAVEKPARRPVAAVTGRSAGPLSPLPPAPAPPIDVAAGAESPLPPPPTDSPARVVRYAPASNALLDDLHAPLVITFDHPPSADEIGLDISPFVPGRLTWRDDRTLRFTPDPAWAPGTRYDVRLGTGWHTWFRTGRLIESVTPADGTSVDPHEPIAIRFGVQVDHASVERAFTLSPTVPGGLRWVDDLHLVFEPTRSLEYRTAYRMGLEGELKDPFGLPLSPDVDGWTFTTRSALVSAAPKNRTDVQQPLQLRFDAAVDRDSVEAALSITPTVAGAFEWQEHTLTFTPDDYWTPNTTYHVSLAATAREADGRPLFDRDLAWDFETGDVPSLDLFGYGPNIQLLGADGERALAVQSYAGRHLTLKLYRLEVAQFLDRYSSSFRGIGPGEDKGIPTDDLALVHTWQQELERRGEVTIPAAVPPGFYVLQAQSGPARDQLIVVLTRHALVLKQAEGQIVTWASTLGDHAPAVGMHLRFYDRDGTLLAEGATEARGLHRANVSLDPAPLIVVGELDGDLTVGGLGQEWEVGWGWWGWWKTSPGVPDATIYPYTDRPIYRPGQTVHARAVIRRDDDAVYSLPGAGEVVLRLRDARDNVIATRHRTPDPFGAVYADFALADGGTVGTYHLEVSALGERVRQSFLVEAYRKPDYEVTLTPARAHVVAGEPLTLTLQANYFFGPPVADAQVELVPYVAGYDRGYRSEETLDYGYPYEKLRRGGRTDAQGQLTVVLPAQVTNQRDRQTWNVEATVTDASGLSVSGHARVVVHRAGFGLSLHTDRYHYRPGRAIPVTVLARDHRALALRTGATVTVGLYGQNGQDGEYTDAIAATTVATDADGRAQATLQTTRSGWYRLRAESTDAAGRKIRAERWLLIYGEGGGWETGRAGELRLSTDRERYAPGDDVALLIESPVSGPALLSFERGTTRRETVIQLDEGVNRLSFELLPDDVPNVHVALAVWRPTAPGDEAWRWQSRPEEELLTARTEILVPADQQRLTVTIAPDRVRYAPRDEAVFEIQIRDQAGQPVRAGFSLALVDEAIFALAADQTPHIFDAFYRPRPDIVRTYHSLRPVRWLGGGRGGGGGGEASPGGSPRSDFPDTAFWAPALTTDADGIARVRVPLPDSLTGWRAVVRAVTPDTKVGQATTEVTVALPVSVRPVLPRFLVQGDQTTLTAVVHNYTGLTQTATVRLAASGLARDGALPAAQGITLPAEGAVAVGWSVVAEELGEARVRMDVTLAGSGPGAHDAVELPLPIVPLAVPQVDTVATEVEGEWVQTVTLPQAAIPDVSRWELAFAPSIASGMLDGLEFLIDYPFG